MKNQKLTESNLPLAILFGKKQEFVEAEPNPFVYNSISQITENLRMDNVGTKCQRYYQTVKKRPNDTLYDTKTKNEVDDYK